MDILFELVKGTWAFLTWIFPMPIALLAFCVWALAVKQPVGISRSRLFFRGCLPLFATPVVILLFGAVFNAGTGQPSVPAFFIFVLLLAHIPLTALLVWKWGDALLVVLAFSALSFYIALCTALVSGMAVTGVWL